MNLFSRNEKLPAAYKPGRLLADLYGELKGLEIEKTTGRSWTVIDPVSGLRFAVTERAEKNFAMHVEVGEFTCQFPQLIGPECRLRINHRGFKARTGIAVKTKGGDNSSEELASALEADGQLTAAMLVLDSKLCELRITPTGSELRIRLIGASRVVMRIPPSRRYVAMGAEQRDALLNTMVWFRDHL